MQEDEYNVFLRCILKGGEQQLKEIEHFYFGNNQGSDNGFRSMNYGIINCTVGGGMLEENYIPSREIRETYIRGNPKPYFHSADLKPVELKLTFGFENFHTGFTPNDRNRALRDLSHWLTKDYYVPLEWQAVIKCFM